MAIFQQVEEAIEADAVSGLLPALQTLDPGALIITGNDSGRMPRDVERPDAVWVRLWIRYASPQTLIGSRPKVTHPGEVQLDIYVNVGRGQQVMRQAVDAVVNHYQIRQRGRTAQIPGVRIHRVERREVPRAVDAFYRVSVYVGFRADETLAA